MEELSNLLMRENMICYFHSGSSDPSEWWCRVNVKELRPGLQNGNKGPPGS